MEERLTEMETLLMHHERTIEQLNQVVCEQQVALDRLAAEVRLIREQMLGLQGSQNRLPSEEEPPPHY